MPPRYFWSAPSGGDGQQISAVNIEQAPVRQQSALLVPDDIVYPPPGGGLLRVPVGGGAAAQMFGTASGDITYWDATQGQWVVTPTSPANGEVPVWDVATEQWVFEPQSIAGAIAYFDNTFSPVGLWNFNGTLADANGVAANDLTLGAGALAFCDIVPSKLGLYVLSGARYQTAARPPALALKGDMSFFAIVQADSVPTVEQAVARFTGTGETEAANALWSLSYVANTNPPTSPRRLQYLSESGAGIDQVRTSGGDASLPPVHNIAMIGWTREADVVQFYYNGLPFGPVSAVITTPTGGTDPSCLLFVGANTTLTQAVHPFVLFTMQVIPSALSAAQVKQLYNQSLGPAFGRLT